MNLHQASFSPCSTKYIHNINIMKKFFFENKVNKKKKTREDKEKRQNKVNKKKKIREDKEKRKNEENIYFYPTSN